MVENLIARHLYYGRRVIGFTYDGFQDGMNNVILELEDGMCPSEVLTDNEYDRFVASFQK